MKRKIERKERQTDKDKNKKNLLGINIGNRHYESLK